MEQGHRWVRRGREGVCALNVARAFKGPGSPALISRGLDGCLSTPSHVASLLRHQGLPRTPSLAVWLCSLAAPRKPALLGLVMGTSAQKPVSAMAYPGKAGAGRPSTPRCLSPSGLCPPPPRSAEAHRAAVARPALHAPCQLVQFCFPTGQGSCPHSPQGPCLPPHPPTSSCLVKKLPQLIWGPGQAPS